MRRKRWPGSRFFRFHRSGHRCRWHESDHTDGIFLAAVLGNPVARKVAVVGTDIPESLTLNDLDESQTSTGRKPGNTIFRPVPGKTGIGPYRRVCQIPRFPLEWH